MLGLIASIFGSKPKFPVCPTIWKMADFSTRENFIRWFVKNEILVTNVPFRGQFKINDEVREDGPSGQVYCYRINEIHGTCEEVAYLVVERIDYAKN